MVIGLEQKFLHRRYTNGQQGHKNILTSLTIGEMQIKTSMRHHLPPIRVTGNGETVKEF